MSVDLHAQELVNWRHLLDAEVTHNFVRYAEFGSSPCGEQTVEKLVSLEERRELAYRDTSPANSLPFPAEHIEVVAAFD